MVEETPTRRSTRARQVNKKYSIDPFEGLDLRASSDTGSSSSSSAETDEDDVDEDFTAQNAVDQELEEDDVVSSVAEDEEDAEFQTAEYPGESALDDNESIIDSELDIAKRSGSKRNALGQRTVSRTHKSSADPAQQPLPAFSIGEKQIATNLKYRTRPISDITHHAAKDSRLIHTFGPSDEDIAPIIMGRDKWVSQITLPTRTPDSKGRGGFSYSFYYTAEMRARERDQRWKWFEGMGGLQSFHVNQIISNMASGDGLRYLPPESVHNFLMGPYPNLTLYGLSTRTSINIEDAFSTDTQSNAKPRRGFILNVGAKPEHVVWVPNKQGATQYLAISAATKHFSDKSNIDTYKHHIHSAFKPSSPTASAIQIWVLHDLYTSGANRRLDERSTPRLEAVFCFDWGPVKSLEFCPMERKIEEIDNVELGLIAGVWGDGHIRVLNLSYPKPDPSSPQTRFIQIKCAAFSSCPPSTLCTSVAWLSTTAVAAGCANGCVAVWDISSSLSPAAKQIESNPQAWFYQTLHQSYILRTVSCWPSRPHLLVTASIDGYHRLTDLRCPDFDFIFSSRTRVAQATVMWHDHTQCAVFVDDNYAFKSLPLRRFFATVLQARAHAPVNTTATSLHHPFVLGGCTDGTVVSYNPIRRILYSKAELFVQIWFKHEWRRGKASTAWPAVASTSGSSAAQSKPADNIKSNMSSKPLSRITEGFKIERPKGSEPKGLENSDQGVVYTTVFEKESAISALCWNPNHEHAGWAAAGMASGLVRIEDIAT